MCRAPELAESSERDIIAAAMEARPEDLDVLARAIRAIVTLDAGRRDSPQGFRQERAQAVLQALWSASSPRLSMSGLAPAADVVRRVGLPACTWTPLLRVACRHCEDAFAPLIRVVVCEVYGRNTIVPRDTYEACRSLLLRRPPSLDFTRDPGVHHEEPWELEAPLAARWAETAMAYADVPLMSVILRTALDRQDNPPYFVRLAAAYSAALSANVV